MIPSRCSRFLSNSKRGAGFTLVEMMVVISIVGILAAVAGSALTKYMRRARTSEAKVQLAKMFDGSSAYFTNGAAGTGPTVAIGSGGTITDEAQHRCPHPTGLPQGGDAGVTPADYLDCNKGPGGRCVPRSFGGGGGGGESESEQSESGYYDIGSWDFDPWAALAFQQEQAHYYHYNYISLNATTGYGQCQFTSQAFGDLDADGTFSTYERAGAADINGINAAAGMFVEQELE